MIEEQLSTILVELRSLRSELAEIRSRPSAITVKEAATRLSVSTRTVERWLAAGKLRKMVLPNGDPRVSDESVTAVLLGSSSN